MERWTTRVPRRGARLALDVVIAACAASAGIHAALTPEHFREAPGPGVGFLVATLLLAAASADLTARPESALAVIAAGAVLGGLVAAYALATTTGVPVLHPEPEPVDGLGLATKAVELVGLVAALRLSVPGRPAGRLIRLQSKGTST